MQPPRIIGPAAKGTAGEKQSTVESTSNMKTGHSLARSLPKSARNDPHLMRLRPVAILRVVMLRHLQPKLCQALFLYAGRVF
jgi:hypothetical protein